jgi:hypothetical protein
VTRPIASGAAGVRQTGQALVESAVAVLLLVPLFVAAYLMWVWQDARHASLVAARFVAFEVALGPGSGAGDAAQARDALGRHVLDARRRGWVSLDHGDAALIDAAAVQVEAVPMPLPDPLDRAESAAFVLLAPALALGSGRLDLRRGGAFRSRVVLPASAVVLPGLTGRLEGPRLTASLALLADPWRAASAGVTRSRVESLSVAGRARQWIEPLRDVRAAIALIEPAFDRLCIGRVEVDVVPQDRLVGGVGAPVDLRQHPCS